jgi:membrane protein DedA with SNARE-associated domain
MPPELAPVLAIAGLILVKEAGLPIPVPGDLIVIGAGVAAGRGELSPGLALVVIVLASIVGGVVQFGLLRSVARPAMLRLLGRFGGTDRVERETERLRRGGARGVAIARSTPGLRIVAIAASALAGVPAAAFVAGLSIGNALFIAAHFGLGYLVGEPIVRAATGFLAPLAIGFVALAVMGGVGWYLIRRRRPTDHAPALLETVEAWADACCPACLALAVTASPSPRSAAPG